MRSKNILSIAAFTIAFLLSTAFAGLFIVKSDYVPLNYNATKTSCFKRHSQKSYVADKIEKIITQDERNGDERDRKIYQSDENLRSPFVSSSFSDYAEAVSEYIDSSESLSAEDTPQDFQKAWRKHMKVWRDYSDFLDKMKNPSTRSKLGETKVAGLESSYSSDITTTWHEVLRVGKNYGAEAR